MANKVVLDLRMAMFSRLVRFPAKYFDDQTSGAALRRLRRDRRHPRRHHGAHRAGEGHDRNCRLLAWLLYLNWKLTLIVFVIGPPIALTCA